jgi:hypothetical protein
MSNPPKCFELPGTLWRVPEDTLAAADWLAHEIILTMLGVLIKRCAEDPIPIVLYSLGASLTSVPNKFDPEQQSFLSFVWIRLQEDYRRYEDTSQRIRVNIDAWGDVSISLGAEDLLARRALESLTASDRQMVKFAAMQAEDDEIARICQRPVGDVAKARAALLAAMQVPQAERDAGSVRWSEALPGVCSLGGKQQIAVTLHIAGHATAEIAMWLNLDSAIVSRLVSDGLKFVRQSQIKGRQHD